MLGPVFLIFLTLKLIGTIDWSWWLIFTPLIAHISIKAILKVMGEEIK